MNKFKCTTYTYNKINMGLGKPKERKMSADFTQQNSGR